MYVQVKTSGGINTVPLESRLMADRRIFVEGSIDNKTACEFFKQVLYLNSEDSSEAIDIFINSSGGEINAGMLMYDVIRNSSAPVRMFCMGMAYSMAAVLFASGRHGRYMLPDSKLMIHEPTLDNRIGGNSSSIKSISDNLTELKCKLTDILSKHTGRTVKEVEKAICYDHYFTPEESRKFGLCDGIVTFDFILSPYNDMSGGTGK